VTQRKRIGRKEGKTLVQVKDGGKFRIYRNASSSVVCCHYGDLELRG
jgi:hypothetical protein